MHSKSDDKEIMIIDKADEIIKKLLKSLLNRHQNNLEKLMKGSEFASTMFMHCIINVIK